MKICTQIHLYEIYFFYFWIFISLEWKSNFRNSRQMVKLLKKIGILRIFIQSLFKAKNHFENQITSSAIFHNIYNFFTYWGLNKLSKHIDSSCSDFDKLEHKGQQTVNCCLKLVSLSQQWCFLKVRISYAWAINDWENNLDIWELDQHMESHWHTPSVNPKLSVLRTDSFLLCLLIFCPIPTPGTFPWALPLGPNHLCCLHDP